QAAALAGLRRNRLDNAVTLHELLDGEPDCGVFEQSEERGGAGQRVDAAELEGVIGRAAGTGICRGRERGQNRGRPKPQYGRSFHFVPPFWVSVLYRRHLERWRWVFSPSLPIERREQSRAPTRSARAGILRRCWYWGSHAETGAIARDCNVTLAEHEPSRCACDLRDF